MARATTKGDLITSANGQFDKMWKLIDSMSEERQKAAFADEMATAGKETHWSRDRNLRDVLVYLYEWHQLLLRWIKAKLDGGYKTVLPEPYNWNTYPAMNVEFWKKHQSTPLTQAKANLKESHKEVMTLIGQFSNDELFVKGAFGLAWHFHFHFHTRCLLCFDNGKPLRLGDEEDKDAYQNKQQIDKMEE